GKTKEEVQVVINGAGSAGVAITRLLLTYGFKNITMCDKAGILCDGAKASCAAKISSALDAALLAHTLAMQGKAYASNTGILQSETGETISCVGHIGRVGMQPTDREIVKLMIR
ncbi:MAG: L-serine ammonia-lyase, iron-sulfur-dependent, subunit alpha, partial [Clostridia bacterium]|nr:L-serine ammonia-lyase, iron-sulfur-dependent, subunit alpha [Clostridia bacterium]